MVGLEVETRSVRFQNLFCDSAPILRGLAYLSIIHEYPPAPQTNKGKPIQCNQLGPQSSPGDVPSLGLWHGLTQGACHRWFWPIPLPYLWARVKSGPSL